ncbi:hypothetical protein MITS9509_01257 [Synechococcus sp. MIT S9509]|uniref:hypothetical protein n=1 Tax=unclassified Synechococcus TaxID=2626047 RepID=UPI0007BC076D|nr:MULTISPECIES: hypothetical protein [unclassified Synechococcus]KZR87405.1 hypothetical protein MITS9504_00822 [Synechococcus sp. MIT S9504]KZR92807.1 hypothetical protein MITS9509_01257 [Synechococcus sp. MIT S9509]
MILKRITGLEYPDGSDIKNGLCRLDQNDLIKLFSLPTSTFARMKNKAYAGMLLVFSVDS